MFRSWLDEHPEAARRAPWFAVAGLCVAHVALGLSLLPSPMFAKYTQAAQLLRDGVLPAERAADFSPLYLLLNSLMGPVTIRVLQSLAGAGLVAAVYAYAKQVFGAAAGFLAAVPMAMAVPLLVYEATLEPDVWIAACAFASCWLIARGVRSTRVLAAAGALAGLGGAMRPSALLFAMFAAVALAVPHVRRGRPLLAVGPVMAFAAAALIAVALPVAALRRMSGSAPDATMSGGPVLHMGNRPEGTGLGAQPPAFIRLTELQLSTPERPDYGHALYRQIARSAQGAQLTASAAGSYWVSRTAAFIRREPRALASLLGRKVVMLLLGPEGHDLVEARDAERRLAGWPLAGAQPLAILGVIGLLLAAVRKRPLGPLWLLMGSVVAVALGFYVVSRYRLAAMPIFCVGSAALGYELRESLTDRRRLVLPGALAAAALASPLVWPFLSNATRLTERAAPQYSAAVVAALGQGELRIATDAFVQMQAANPYSVRLRDVRGIPFESAELAARSLARSLAQYGEETPADVFYAAVLAARAGHCEDAEAAAAVAANAGFASAIFDWSVDPDLLIAECRLRRGDRTGAVEAALTSLRRRPGTLDGLSFAVAGLSSEGKDAQPYASELAELHDPASAAHALAHAYNAWGRWELALAQAEAALRVVPEAGIAEYERARALMGLVRNEEALASYRRALELFPAHPFPASPFDTLIAAQVEQAPQDPAVLAVAADHELRRGRVGPAKALARRAVEASGGAPSPALQGTVQVLSRFRE